ncbi:Fic family protein [Myxococcus sp. CA033]|uniref:Fic family protein n=1 Tax=Myxococcus sp. CA033 TaxID=2741516 RepID=UPI00157AAF3E|nr:Fic family protein [Myxococcus sp. CA033]NTX32833.1 Fic family protein [Myxococcus sp. CA033]
MGQEKSKVWYKNYDALNDEVDKLRTMFKERCSALGRNPDQVLSDYNRDAVARIVFESNWQEGIYLEQGRTAVLAVEAFDKIDHSTGPHLDMDSMLRNHRVAVAGVRRAGVSPEELAAYNLSVMHYHMGLVREEIGTWLLALLFKFFQELRDGWRGKSGPSPSREVIDELNAMAAEALRSRDRIEAPMTGGVEELGEYLRVLMKDKVGVLGRPMKIEHIHFLHRTLMMGVLPLRKCGVFRRVPVHVGNPEIVFPPSSMVPDLMAEFCGEFPRLAEVLASYDSMLMAARFSHRFTKVHPYEDGNGRISRAVMNLILSVRHPIVYLKADAKGRHRYSQSLRRADRGNIEPLASLIAMAVRDAYLKILRSLSGA